MKKIKLTVLGLATLLMSIGVFVSCEKEEANTDNNIESKPFNKNSIERKHIKVGLKDYGFYHNEAVSMYIEEKLKGDINKLRNKNITEVSSSIVELMSKKHPSIFNKSDIVAINDYYKGIEKGEDYDFLEYWNTNKREYLANKLLSVRLYNFYDDVFKNTLDYNVIISKIGTLKKEGDLTNNERNSLIAFESVLTSSKEYWESTDNTTSRKNPCTPRTIIADAAVSGVFWMAPPVSIFGGAISSLFTYYSDASCE